MTGLLSSKDISNQKLKPNSLIFLIGFMGCGKTTIGRKLASRLDCAFVDLDHLFEAREGMTIARYFELYGEERFRQEESAVLKDTGYPDRAVVATGGGLPCFFDNMEWMKAKGTTVYIKLPPRVLADRLQNADIERPVLQQKTGDDLVAHIELKLAEREPYYSRANVIADGLSLTAEKLATLLSAGI
jgi:shikimate kinase